MENTKSNLTSYAVIRDIWDADGNRMVSGTTVFLDSSTEVVQSALARGHLEEIVSEDDLNAVSAEGRRLITMLDTKTGKVSTHPYTAAVRRRMAFGEAIETIPSNPDDAVKWLADIRQSAVDAWKKRERDSCSKYHSHEEPWPIFEDYERWCAQANVHSLPADESKIVRWMLSRAAEGHFQMSFAPRWASVVADIHNFTRHPPHHLGRTASSAFHRAIDFTKKKLRETHRNIHEIPSLALSQASEMFPDGNIPMKYDEIAA